MQKSIHSTRYAIFLKVLREARERAGLTQVQLARKIGETQTFVSKCERGERRIDVIELRTFCRAFGLSLGQFVGALELAISRTRIARK
jgi:transcriptional regulator with XRE-family HTH domain